MDQATSDRLKMYVKWSYFGKVDDPDNLVQISRDGEKPDIEKIFILYFKQLK